MGGPCVRRWCTTPCLVAGSRLDGFNTSGKAANSCCTEAGRSAAPPTPGVRFTAAAAAMTLDGTFSGVPGTALPALKEERACPVQGERMMEALGPLARRQSGTAVPEAAWTSWLPAASNRKECSFRKSNPRMGKDTAARRKLQVKELPQN